ncbi:MAG TPA: GMC family oxidoreductase [Longimicrobium sp.]|nr:GMC family oxidoreductase [Longimicrobium sp.]
MDGEPRAAAGRAPDVFRRGGWVPMRMYDERDEVDFAIVGTGAGGGTLACRLAEAGFRVVAFEAGPFWRPLEDFASDEAEQEKLYWKDERITGGADPITLGSNNSGRGVGGGTVHFTMVAVRWRPDWFRSRSRLGYGVDWPLRYEDLEPYYRQVERALQVAGPVRYPWGPPRPRYPRRAHRLNAAAQVFARGCDALGIPWAEAPLATLSSPRGEAPPCVYRGFCAVGCSTNAKQSALTTWIPRALAAGAEIRDLAMVGRVEVGPAGRATGVLYHRAGEWRRQRARRVVVAGYSIETPRLLLASASPRFPDGLANGSGWVGRGLMVHSNHGVWGTFDDEIRQYKGPPVMAITEHWNYTDAGKDAPGGYLFGSQGPLPRAWAQTLATGRGLWGEGLRREVARYNHVAGVKMVGEVEPQEENRVELDDETDRLGLRIPRVTFAYSEADRRLIRHAERSMADVLAAAGGRELWIEADTAHLVGGCRMGSDPETSVTDSFGRTWEVPNLWICDGSLFPTSGGANPSLTIQAIACRTAARMKDLARRRALDGAP